MKKITLCLVAFFCFAFSSNAQEAAKAVYAEIGGPGLASINYDMRLQKKNDGLGFRVGVGGFSLSYNDGYGDYRSSIFLLPVGLNYLLGKDDKHFFELGAGFTYLKINSKDVSNNTSDPFSSSFGHLNLGYRLQPKDGGFVFRAGIVPVFGKGFFYPWFAGVSFGYKF